MSKAAVSIFVFGWYILANAIILIFAAIDGAGAVWTAVALRPDSALPRAA